MTAAPPLTRALFNLWPKQAFAWDLIFEHGVEQPLYGGAAGGGKSAFARAVAADLANRWPGSDVAIFRKTDAELQENHVNKWELEVAPFVPGGRFFQQRMFYHWPAPAWCWDPKGAPCPHSSRTHFNHVDDNRGAKKYQGPEYAAEIIDEATHFHGRDIDFLYTRVRATEQQREAREIIGPDGRSYSYPGWPGYRKLQLLTANPGDVGHQYMLDTYIDPVNGLEFGDRDSDLKRIVDGPHPLTNVNGDQRWLQTYRRPDGTEAEILVDVTDGQRWSVEIDLGADRGKVKVRRAFIPARLDDNPALDPLEYAANLAVGSVEQRKRLLDGDWTYAQDRVFSTLVRDSHYVDGGRIFGQTSSGAVRPPPSSWARGAGQDHGTAKPTACILVTNDPEGFLIAYKEYYAAGPVGGHVRGIKDMLLWDGHPDLTVEVDPRIVHANQGTDVLISVADIYRYLGEPPLDPIERQLARDRGINIRQARITDVAALDSLEDMFEPDSERAFPYWHPQSGQYGSPLLFITRECPNLWRELTNLQRGKMDDAGHYQEGIKNGQADHAFDAIKRIAEPLRRRVISPPRSGPHIILEAV